MRRRRINDLPYLAHSGYFRKDIRGMVRPGRTDTITSWITRLIPETEVRIECGAYQIMNARHGVVVLFMSTVCPAVSGCDRKPEPDTARPTASGRPLSSEQPTDRSSGAPTAAVLQAHARTSEDDRVAGAKGPAKTLSLTGLTMTPPAAWVRESVSAGPLAPKAAFSLPPVEGDPHKCTLRITHYPNMKGMPGIDDMNINRWLRQVTKADGSPHTRDQAKIEVSEFGHVRLTILDLSGTVSTGMGPAASKLPGHRMIAAIVDHPRGPHFVKVVGGLPTIKKWRDAILTFLKSAKTQ